MDAISQSLRHSPRFVLRRSKKAPQFRLYTKATLDRKRRLPASRSSGPEREEARTARWSPRRSGLAPLPKPAAFGKPRDQSSNAAKAERFKESRRIEKALLHEHHGEKVYAYAHIRTGQVVYSLTRVMDNNQILRQLVFHGKKTVPAALRRDHWTPYFSLHFPSSYSGLLAYHHLRELSLQRQLQPPDHLVMTNTQYASETDREKMTREEEEKWDEENEGKEYPDGVTRLARRGARAKTLMRQKETSVADVAFVVEQLQQDGHLRSAQSVEKMMRTRQGERIEEAGRRRRKRLRANLRLDESREQRYKEMTKKAQEGTKWGLEKYAAKRISVEHDGTVVDPKLGRAKVVLPGREVDSRKQDQGEGQADTNAAASSSASEEPSSLTVRILWSDLRDAAYAANWPRIVSHGELERLAVSRSMNENGQVYFTDRSVHVIGGLRMGDDGWMRGNASLPPWRVGLAESDGGGVGGDRGKSRKEQTEELEREGVVVEQAPRRSGVVGWVKARLGMAA